MLKMGAAKKCRKCGGGIWLGYHYPGCPKERGSKPKPSEAGYGVFVFAEWLGGRVVEQKERGYVARGIDCIGVPYSLMTPLRIFKRRADADKLATKLTFGG